MPNKFFNSAHEKHTGGARKVDKRVNVADAAFNVKAGPAGGLPGKAQGRDRSGGVRKIKQHTKSEGL